MEVDGGTYRDVYDYTRTYTYTRRRRQVNRASPEEKILDFNDRMVVLTKVMRRQELLHKIFR